jgi:hypothetical protein
MSYTNSLRFLVLVAILVSVILLVASNSTLVWAQRGASLADMALQAEDINQVPGVRKSYLSKSDRPDRLVGGYALWEADQRLAETDPVRRYHEFYTIEGVIGNEADHVYVSQELYRYSDVAEAQAAADYLAEEAARHGSKPVNMGTSADLQCGVVPTQDGLGVYWCVGTKGSIFSFLSLHGVRGSSFTEDVFKALATQAFQR